MIRNRPKVVISMVTYLHEAYIEEAVKGVLLQKCNFEYKVIITNDNSPDNTHEICLKLKKAYPEYIIYEKLDKNKGMIGNWVHNLKICMQTNADFIAICEGDDYWTDPLKLQKQIDFLEANGEYGLVHTDYYKYHQSFQKFERSTVFNIRDVEHKSEYNELLEESVIHTATVCLRSDILRRYMCDIKPEQKKWMLGDYQIWLYFSINSKIKYFPEKSAVYRILEHSASHRKDRENRLRAIQSIHDVRYYFINKYGCREDTLKKIDEQYLIDTIHQKINIGYDLNNHAIIAKNLLLKKENKIPISILDKYKLFSTKTFLFWKLSRILLESKRYLSRYSGNFVREI